MKKFIIFISIVFAYLSNITLGECYQNYCWETDHMMLIAAEKEFVKNMENGDHEYDLKKSNMCQYHLSSLAYGFAVVESGMGDSKVANKTNNRFSMRKGSGKYQYIRQEERGKIRSGNYMKYPNPILSAVDFMYLFKYAYYCKLSMVNISMYKVGSKAGDANTQRYYNNLLSSVKYFEKKYFGDGQTLDDYNTSKEGEKLHGSAGVQLSKVNFSTNQTASVVTIKTSSPSINFSTNQPTTGKILKISGTIEVNEKYKRLNKLLGGEIKIQKQGSTILLIGKNGKKYKITKTGKTITTSKPISKPIDLSNARVFTNQTSTSLIPKTILANKTQQTTEETSKPLNTLKADDFLDTLKEENLDTKTAVTTDLAQQEIYKNKVKKDLQKMNLNYDTFMNLVKETQTGNNIILDNKDLLFESKTNISGS